MYVEKFEANTLDEALKAIKQKLGPDAIILKTKTNKGLKGAFGKPKIEIMAAISEKTYTKKAKVDQVFDENQKQEFYQAPAGHVSSMIDQYNSTAKAAGPSNSSGYAKLGLNRSVRSSKNEETVSPLDNFLDSPLETSSSMRPPSPAKEIEPRPSESPSVSQVSARDVQDMQELQEEIKVSQSLKIHEDLNSRKIDDLEQKIYELTQKIENYERPEPRGVYQLRTSLRSLDLNEAFIRKLIKKASFELSDAELEEDEIVF